jgi:hypothetical protein
MRNPSTVLGLLEPLLVAGEEVHGCFSAEEDSTPVFEGEGSRALVLTDRRLVLLVLSRSGIMRTVRVLSADSYVLARLGRVRFEADGVVLVETGGSRLLLGLDDASDAASVAEFLTRRALA